MCAYRGTWAFGELVMLPHSKTRFMHSCRMGEGVLLLKKTSFQVSVLVFPHICPLIGACAQDPPCTDTLRIMNAKVFP